MNDSAVLAWLFRWRGVLAGGLGVVVGALAQPTRASLVAGLPVLLLGLALRAFAFAHLGPRGRTRDPRPPVARVRSGPYRFLDHPVYLGNLLMAAGLIVTAALPRGPAILALGAACLLWGALARAEGRVVSGLPLRPSQALGLRQVARSERSTWLSIAALLALQGVAAATRLG